MNADDWEPECANCGSSVHVVDGKEFNEGDWCWDCLGTHHREIFKERDELRAELESLRTLRHATWLGWLNSLDIDHRAAVAHAPAYEVVRKAWFDASAECDKLKQDAYDWRKGVELIAAAAGYKGQDLSCVGIAEHIMALLANKQD